jgi:hypothetical protein
MAVNFAPRASEGAARVPFVAWYKQWNAERIAFLLTIGVFLIYGTFRAFENNFYSTVRMYESVARPAGLFANGVVPHYLSPFYSPPIQDWIALPFALSPALFLLAFPGSFRLTCYFCRRTYYRAIFGSPPGCAAREVMQRSNYSGETRLPLSLQNLHRYTLYFILIFVAFHWLHFVEAFAFADQASGRTRLGIGVGTLVIALDTFALTAYVVSCHSFRHLIGGIMNRFSANPTRFKFWQKISWLNERHGLFFWVSLISVGLADVYIRLVSAGIISDLHVLLP